MSLLLAPASRRAGLMNLVVVHLTRRLPFLVPQWRRRMSQVLIPPHILPTYS